MDTFGQAGNRRGVVAVPPHAWGLGNLRRDNWGGQRLNTDWSAAARCRLRHERGRWPASVADGKPATARRWVVRHASRHHSEGGHGAAVCGREPDDAGRREGPVDVRCRRDRYPGLCRPQRDR